MGSWCETCGLTNTPVEIGDPCVMVILDATVEKLKGHHFLRFGEPLGYDFFDVLHVKEMVKGVYDDYGKLENHEGQQEGELALFFHQDVWDACQSQDYQDERIVDREAFDLYRKFSKCSWETQYELLKELDKVLHTAYQARRNVLGAAAYRGCQVVDPEMQRFVAGLIDKRVTALEIADLKNRDESP